MRILIFVILTLMGAAAYADDQQYHITIQPVHSVNTIYSMNCSNMVPQCTLFLSHPNITAQVQVDPGYLTFEFEQNTQKLWIAGQDYVRIPVGRRQKLEKKTIALTTPPILPAGEDAHSLLQYPVIRSPKNVIAELEISVISIQP